MATFLTCLKLKALDADNRWQLTAPLVYQSDIVGRVEVPAGFVTDLASVPRVPIAYWFWGGRSHHEAVVHDYLFRKGALPECTWHQANAVFQEAMKVRGKSAWIRKPMFWGVSLGSAHLWKVRDVKDDLS